MSPSSHGPLGIFGGTFDPVHIGHLRAALEVVETLGFQKVILIPAGIPPHKRRPDITSFYHRYEMLKLSVEGEPRLEVSDIEGKRRGPSYTVETLGIIGRESLDTFFILGSEAFLEIHTWKEFERLFSITSFVILIRDPGHMDAIRDYLSGLKIAFSQESNTEWTLYSQKKIIFFKPTSIQISGSLVRRLRREGKSIRYLVPDKVNEYVRANGLYIAP